MHCFISQVGIFQGSSQRFLNYVYERLMLGLHYGQGHGLAKLLTAALAGTLHRLKPWAGGSHWAPCSKTLAERFSSWGWCFIQRKWKDTEQNSIAVWWKFPYPCCRHHSSVTEDKSCNRSPNHHQFYTKFYLTLNFKHITNLIVGQQKNNTLEKATYKALDKLSTTLP